MMDIIFEEKLAISDDEKKEVLAMLPNSFETRVTSYNHNTLGLYIEIRTNINDKEKALKWKFEFERMTKTTYNADSTYEENTKKTIFKCVYHCLHNTRPKAVARNPHCKHTKCQAKMIINVKQSGMKRSKDIYLKTLPCQISLRHEHNHSINSADALQHKKPSEDVKEKFVQLYSKGHSPSSALEYFKTELQQEYPDEYLTIVADGSRCPKRKWCYQLYYNIFKKEYGDPTGPKMTEALEESISSYNAKCNIKKYKLSSQQFLPVNDSREKVLLAKLLNCDTPHNWFISLCDAETQEASSTSINLAAANILEGSSSGDNKIPLTEDISNQRVEEVERNLIQAFNIILHKFRQKPDIYLQPINKFSELVQGIKTDSAMISALHTFGKYSGLPLKKNGQGSKRIGVQPTTVARRRVPVGGRNVAISGRPPKSHQEHTYVKRKRTKVTDLPPIKKSALPHSLSLIVEN